MNTQRDHKQAGDHRARWGTYVIAVVASLVTCLVHYLLGFSTGDDPAFVLFIIPITLSSYFGGLGPGLVATVASAAFVAYFFTPPIGSFAIESVDHLSRWIIMIASGVLISVLTGSLRRSSQVIESEGTEEEGAGSSVERTIQTGFAVALAILGIVGIVAYFSVIRLTEDAKWVAHTDEVIANLNSLLSSVTDVETSSRGYAITAEDSYLEPYQNGIKEDSAILLRLKQLTADNALQQRRLEMLSPILAERVAVAKAVIDARKSQGLEGAQRVVLTGKGKVLQDRIRAIVDEMIATERELLNARQDRTKNAATITKLVIVSGATIATICVGFALFFIRRQLVRRARLEAELRNVNERLEVRVRERTNDLAQSNASLRSSEAELREAQRLTKVGSWKLAGETVTWSEELHRIFGHDPALPAPSYSEQKEIIAPESWARLQVAVERATKTGTPYELDLEIVCSDGKHKWITARGEPVSDEDGRIIALRGTAQDITERKRAEEALLANRARLDAALASMTDAVFISDTEGRFIEFNDAFATFHKFRDKAECAKTLAEYPAFLDVFMANGELVPLDQWAVPRALRGETATDVEFTLRRKDTGETWVGSYSFAPICDKGGEIVGSVVVGRDVTERKGVEEALRQSEERFRTMANSIPQLAWIAHADGFIYWYNERWYEYTGTTPEQMEGWGWQYVHDPLVLPKVLEQWQASIATGQPFDMDFPLRGADGRFRPFLTRILPLKDAEGHVVQWFGTNTDITERLDAEQRLRKSQERLAGIIGSAMDGIISVDEQQHILVFNAAAEKMFGYTASEMLGQSLDRLIPERFRAAHAGHIRKFEQTHVTRRTIGALGTIFGLRASGEEFPIEASISQTAAGEVKLFTVILRDVTERRLAEQLRLENLRLDERSRHVEEANRLKSEFLANMSHELRTPLNAIIGFTEMLIDRRPGPLNPKQQEYLGDVYNSAIYLLQLINDVLDLAKVEAGKMVFNPEQFSIGKAIEEVCAVTKAIAQKKGIGLKVNVAPALRYVTLDQQKFKQVLYNLLSNAIKFTDEGGKVEIRAAMHDAHHFKLVVSDTGIGIKTEDIARLFKAVRTAQIRSVAGGHGTGLGTNPENRRVARRYHWRGERSRQRQ